MDPGASAQLVLRVHRAEGRGCLPTAGPGWRDAGPQLPHPVSGEMWATSHVPPVSQMISEIAQRRSIQACLACGLCSSCPKSTPKHPQGPPQGRGKGPPPAHTGLRPKGVSGRCGSAALATSLGPWFGEEPCCPPHTHTGTITTLQWTTQNSGAEGLMDARDPDLCLSHLSLQQSPRVRESA